MTRILILLASLVLGGESFALPPCPTSGYKHNCFGTHTWADGEKYVGEFKDDKFHGHGTYTFSSGSKYVGEIKDGKQHGQGTYTRASGSKYVGEFKDDKFHGQGTYTFADGSKRVGEMKDGRLWEGITYYPSGQEQGTYSNGRHCHGCKPTARQLAIVREIQSNQIVTTTISGSVWCAKKNYIYKSASANCHSGGKAYAFKHLAQAEHQRLKKQATTASSSSKVWCATGVSVIKQDEAYCRNRNGKGFSTKAQAQAEHKRLKGTATAKSAAAKDQTQREREAVSAFGALAWAIQQKVSSNWSEPGDFSGMSVSFLVKVDRDGNVISVTITNKSGDARLDESAENAIFKASPLPFPTETIYYEYLKEFNFVFKPGIQGVSWCDNYPDSDSCKDEESKSLANANETQSDGSNDWVSWRLGEYAGKFKGELTNGLPNGYGVFSVKRDHGDDYPWVSASVSGQWNDGVPQGMMSVTFELDDDTIEIGTYTGKMNAVGQFHGYGVLTFGADRDASVVGTWKDDKPWNASILAEGEVVASFIEGEEQLKDESDRRSTVKERPEKLLGTGTGFVVNKHYVVTAEHVLEDCNAVSIVHGHGEIGAQTAARDTSNDLGLLRLNKPLLHTAKLRGSPDLRVGDAAINYGYPLFGELSDSAKLNAGYVNSLAGYNNDSGVIQYSAPTQPGNSGGPVLDQSGNVIGVVSSGLGKRYADATGHIAQNVNFAVKSNIVENFLQSNNIPFEKANSTKKLELPDIAEKAERFTVLVGCWGQQSNQNYDKCLKLQIGKLTLEAAQRHCAPLKD